MSRATSPASLIEFLLIAPHPQEQEYPMTDKKDRRGPKILIAGAGIGGLVLAVGLLKNGFDVQIFERDLTAIRGEGKYRGPIQVGRRLCAYVLYNWAVRHG